MEYLNRGRLPVFTPRLDLTAEDLNAQAETICAAINELAGRIQIIKNMIPEEERSQYAEELNYPILDKIEELTNSLAEAWDTIRENKLICDQHYQDTLDRIAALDLALNSIISDVRTELLSRINEIDRSHLSEEQRIESKFDSEYSDLERRLNALDDAAARKSDLAALIDRINYLQTNSLPSIGDDGYWYIGTIKTSTKAQGPEGRPGQDGVPGPTGSSGVALQSSEPTDPNINVWIDPSAQPGEDSPTTNDVEQMIENAIGPINTELSELTDVEEG